MKYSILMVAICSSIAACIPDRDPSSDSRQTTQRSLAQAEIPAGTPESEKAMQKYSSLSYGKDLAPLDKYLTEHPELVNRTYLVPQEGNTILHLAAEQGNARVVAMLMSHGADPTLPNAFADNTTPFTVAAKRGRVETVKEFLRLGVDVNLQNPASETRSQSVPMSALDYASWCGRSEIVRLLLENGAKLDSNPVGKSYPALHHAMQGHVETIQFTGTGLPPCPALDNSEVIELLLAHGASLSNYNFNDDQALHVAIKGNASFTVKYLLEHHREKFDVNVPGRYGFTPLNMAAMHTSGHKSGRPYETTDMIVKLLLEYGAIKDKKSEPTGDGIPKTSYEYAVENNAGPKVIELLKP